MKKGLTWAVREVAKTEPCSQHPHQMSWWLKHVHLKLGEPVLYKPEKHLFKALERLSKNGKQPAVVRRVKRGIYKSIGYKRRNTEDL